MKREYASFTQYANAFACQPKIVRLVRDPAFINTGAEAPLIPVYEPGLCPQRNDQQGCPLWVETTETSADGAERLLCGCLGMMQPIANVHVIKASNRPAAGIESFRNAVIEVLERIRSNAGALRPPLEAPALESKPDETHG